MITAKESKNLTRKEKKDLGRRIWATSPGLEVVHRDEEGIDIGGREHDQLPRCPALSIVLSIC